MARPRFTDRKAQAGFTLVEVAVASVLAGLLFLALAASANLVLQAWGQASDATDLERDAAFAMGRIAQAVLGTSGLLIPQRDNLATTTRDESVRDVLAVLLDPTLDRNGDGYADADNDKDGKVDEDLGDDITKDGVAGIVGLDYNGDGIANNGLGARDDDEDGAEDEDAINGLDDDRDGLVDEDSGSRMYGSGNANDDGDGATNEEWLDVVAFRVSGGNLLERTPNANAASGNDYTERVIATGVTAFQVQRLVPASGERAVSLQVTLTLTGSGGRSVTLTQRLRVGGAR